MKSLRITTAKTRKGVIAWLAKHNPFLSEKWLYDQCEFIAVHVHRYTGAIVYYETPQGVLVKEIASLRAKAA